MYGIPTMKLEKEQVTRRVNLMAEEGIEFVTGVAAGTDVTLQNYAKSMILSFLQQEQGMRAISHLLDVMQLGFTSLFRIYRKVRVIIWITAGYKHFLLKERML